MPSQYEDTHKLYQAERAYKARNLRILGYTYKQISDQLGVSIDTVRKDILRHVEDLPKEQALEYRENQVALHEMMISKWAPKALKGDYRAAMVVAKYDQLRTDLLGTNRVEDDSGEQVARGDLAAMMDAIKRAAS